MDLLLRAQQFTGPVMAKGLEDTALYRFNPLIARNEVGARPGRGAVSAAGFHAVNAERLARMPRTMLTTSTHDTKRGEDARARIAALTRHALPWGEKVREWHAILADPDQPIDRNEEYFFYQLLLGAWPAEWRQDEIATADLELFADRVAAAMLKSAREAGVNTRWTFGDAGYEAALAAFVGRALAPQGRFLRVLPVLRGGRGRRRHRDLARSDGPEADRSGRAGHLPGRGIVGAEPGRSGQPSSRRFRRRADLLDRPLPSAAATDPFAKFEITRRLLKLRHSNPRLFAEGSYQPLAVDGPEAEAVCAFARLHGDAGLVVAVPLQGARQRAGAEVRIALPRRQPALLVAGVDGCGHRSRVRGQLRSVSPRGDAYRRSVAARCDRGPMHTARYRSVFEARPA